MFLRNEAAQHCRKLGLSEGLAQDFHDSQLTGSIKKRLRKRVGTPRNKHQPWSALLSQSRNSGGQFPTIDTRHHQIRQNDVKILLLEQLPGRETIFGQSHRETQILEQILQE